VRLSTSAVEPSAVRVGSVDDLSIDPLTPVAFLRRSAEVFRHRTAVVDDEGSYTYAQLWEHCTALAGLLRERGIRPGDRVAVLAPNTRLLLEAHYAVPLAGAVIVPLNVRVTAAELSYVVAHSGASVLLYDDELEGIASATNAPEILAWSEIIELRPRAEPFAHSITDERGLLSINYTSGTSGKPKGVMYHHRGAYLQALAMVIHSKLDSSTVFLWTLPMFHCNGWAFTWGVTAAGGTHRCLRKVDGARIWELIDTEGVSHFEAAPSVLISLAHHPLAKPARRRILVGTGGAPPSPTLLARLDELNLDVTHMYGLTETFGPAVINEWRTEWNQLPAEERAALKARQGIGNIVSTPVRVLSAVGEEVPADATTIGEVALRGNNVMSGYYRDADATATSVSEGFFRTGDLGVRHPDGYIELRDRAKDIIISGGENIASIEIEQVLVSHPAVLEVAVIAVSDPKWGEVPAAYVTLRDQTSLTAAELTAYARERLPHFKAPKHVVFGPLPKTATGKVEKYKLRDSAREQPPG
jgi:fatty-acyl-CoA synthase